MEIHWLADCVRYQRMTTEELRQAFLLDSLHTSGEVRLAYVDAERAVVGFAAPEERALRLPNDPLLRACCFLERRELGVLNIGGGGVVHVDGATYELDNQDCLYLGRGNVKVEFASNDAKTPAAFYLLSYPAHQSYPIALVRKQDVAPTEIGSDETCNHRSIYKYIHKDGAQSCQLVMGVTHLHTGSVWNTMPPHTHGRRSEIYLYFNVEPSQRIFHFMGPPNATRHLMLADREAVVSPIWSIHAGVGSSAYSFCWGMGGENQDYADMDLVAVKDLL